MIKGECLDKSVQKDLKHNGVRSALNYKQKGREFFEQLFGWPRRNLIAAT